MYLLIPTWYIGGHDDKQEVVIVKRDVILVGKPH